MWFRKKKAVLSRSPDGSTVALTVRIKKTGDLNTYAVPAGATIDLYEIIKRMRNGEEIV